jgi:hypothetical protein
MYNEAPSVALSSQSLDILCTEQKQEVFVVQIEKFFPFFSATFCENCLPLSEQTFFGLETTLSLRPSNGNQKMKKFLFV